MSIFFISCSTGNMIDNASIAIPLEKSKNDAVLINDIFELEGWIELESSKDAMLSDVRKIEKTNNAIYILDGMRPAKILKFDNSGKFICKIGNIGKGRGEYNFCNDFSVDPKTGNVLILDGFSRILTYDSNGHFLKSSVVGKMNMSKIQATKDGIFTSSVHRSYNKEKDDYLLYQFDDSLNMVNQWIPIQSMGGSAIVSSLFQKANNNLYYIDEMFYSLYRYDQKTKEFSKEIFIDFANPCSIEAFTNRNLFSTEQHKTDFIKEVVFGRGNIFIIYNISGESQCVVIDVASGKILKEAKWIGFTPYMTSADNGTIYAIYSPELFNLTEIDKSFPQYPIKKPTPENNFVIAKLRIKSFNK